MTKHSPPISEHYTDGLCAHYVQYYLKRSPNLPAILEHLKEMLLEYKTLSEGVVSGEEVQVVLDTPQLGISVTHRAIMEVLSGICCVEVTEVCTCPKPKTIVMVLEGLRTDVLALIPMFYYATMAYGAVTRKIIDALTIPRPQKVMYRKEADATFCKLIEITWTEIYS